MADAGVARADEAARPSPAPIAHRRGWLERTIGIDSRALAGLRIGLGVVLLIDLAMRAQNLTMFYTDLGVFPRERMDPWMWQMVAPLHWLGGSFRWEASLFAIAALFAAGLALGYHTRIAAIASWLLLTSLQARTPIVNDLGDDILRVCLFWSMFLPLGRRWSLDARRARAPDVENAPLCSIPGLAYLLQVAFVYFFTALLKSGADWHQDGTALYYALHIDALATSFGVWLRQFLPFLTLVTRATLALEYVGPFLLFAPWWPIRTAAVVSFWALHLGIAASYRLGIFPWTDLVVLIPFLPAPVWDRLERLAGRTPRPAQPPHPDGGRFALALAACAGAILLYVIGCNLESVWPAFPMPGWLTDAGTRVRINQQWRMFTPTPLHESGWYVIPGRLADGRLVDLSVHGPALTWQKPALISGDYPSYRTLTYMIQIRDPANVALRRRWIEWACRQWNRNHPAEERLERIEMYFMAETTRPPGQEASLEKRPLIGMNCPGPANPVLAEPIGDRAYRREGPPGAPEAGGP